MLTWNYPQKTDKKLLTVALAGVAQWIECQPVNQTFAGSIPSQGTFQGLRARSPVGGSRGTHTLMFLSLSFFFFSPL